MTRDGTERPSRRTTLLLPLVLAAWTAAGCSGGEDGGERTTVRDTVGDTVFARTTGGGAPDREARLVEELRIGRFEGPEEYTFGEIAGLAVGPDGSIYVVDRQAPALRRYAADGSLVRTIGRKGGGPGEYEQPDGGVAVLPDGRVLLRDPANARINVYGPEGEFLEEWRIRGGMYTSTPLTVDTAGSVYHPVFEFSDEGTEWKYVHFSPEGAVTDTLAVPDLGHETPIVEAVRESDSGRSMSRSVVPFSPRETWTLSPLGTFVGGVSDRYRVYLLRQDGRVLAIERDRAPVRVDPDERANERERIVANMRNVDPSWSWDGPPIPDTKPAFRDVWADLDGRVWVLLHTEGEPIPAEEIEEPEDPRARPPDRWRESMAFDLFEPDGTWRGTVRAPDEMSLHPRMAARGDRVWAVVRDELDVPYVVRYRVVHDAEPPPPTG